MTAPAAAEPQAPVSSPVLLRVTEPALMDMLRLPEGVSLRGAQAEHYPHATLVLYLEMAGVPDGADEVVPVYARESPCDDGVRLAGLRWLRSGDEIAPGG